MIKIETKGSWTGRRSGRLCRITFTAILVAFSAMPAPMAGAVEVPSIPSTSAANCLALAADERGMYLADSTDVAAIFPASYPGIITAAGVSPDRTAAAYVSRYAPDTVSIQRLSGAANASYTFPNGRFTENPILAVSMTEGDLIKVERFAHREHVFQYLHWDRNSGTLEPVTGAEARVGADCTFSVVGGPVCINDSQVIGPANKPPLLQSQPRSAVPLQTVAQISLTERRSVVASELVGVSVRVVTLNPETGAALIAINESGIDVITTRLERDEWTRIDLGERTGVLSHDTDAAHRDTTVRLSLADEATGLYRYDRIAVMSVGARSWLLAAIADNTGLQRIAALGSIAASGFEPQNVGGKWALSEAVLTSPSPPTELRPTAGDRQLLIRDAHGFSRLTLDVLRVYRAPGTALNSPGIYAPIIRSIVRLPKVVVTRTGGGTNENVFDWSCR